MTKNIIESMQEQWIEFCRRNNCLGNPKEHFEKIRKQHLIPIRHYHTFDGHIPQGLEIFNEFKHLCENSDSVYYAWMNHDAIYDPKDKDNEEKSAEFAYHLAFRMGLPYTFAKAAHGLILATKHLDLPKTTNEKLIVDIDLSIFGQPEPIFDAYEENIRKEYEFYPPEVYNPGRANILEMFKNRKPLYRTPQIREKYEKKAKENLQEVLKS